MILRCAWCSPPHILGEISPLDDKTITDGMCAAAEWRVHAEMDRQGFPPLRQDPTKKGRPE